MTDDLQGPDGPVSLEDLIASAEGGDVGHALELLRLAAEYLEGGEALPQPLAHYLAAAFREIREQTRPQAFRPDAPDTEQMPTGMSASERKAWLARRYERQPARANFALNLRPGQGARPAGTQQLSDPMIASELAAEKLREARGKKYKQGESPKSVVADSLGISERTLDRAVAHWKEIRAEAGLGAEDPQSED